MRAAVTGWALRTPLGATPEGVVARLLSGDRAAQPNPHFAADTYPCALAAPIPGGPAPSPHGRILHRMGRLALEAAHEALAGVPARSGPRLGVFAAMGGLRAHWNELLPALWRQRDDFRGSWASGLKDLHPFWMLRHLSNNVQALLAQDLGAGGDGVTLSGASAGAAALAAASAALAEGAIDAALVLAYDSLIEPETLIELTARGALATCSAAELGAPYGSSASGAVPGEAAAAVLLQPEGTTDRVLAFIEAADGADGSKALPDPDTLARVVGRLTGDDPVPVSVIDGCALARLALDAAEREALARIVGPDARLIATQAATGSLGAAAPLVQAIALAGLLRRGSLPPIAGLGRAAPGPLVPLTAAVRTEAGTALAVSVGSPGLVAAIRVSLPASARKDHYRSHPP